MAANAQISSLLYAAGCSSGRRSPLSATTILGSARAPSRSMFVQVLREGTECKQLQGAAVLLAVAEQGMADGAVVK